MNRSDGSVAKPTKGWAYASHVERLRYAMTDAGQVPDGKRWNRKGLVSETGKRKLAFDVLATWYADANR